MPINTTSLLTSLRSAISCATRVNARWIAGAFRMGEASGMEGNSKFEGRNPKQMRNPKSESAEIEGFELASKFEIRISDFEGPKS
jgi:hypothetical protein